MMVFKYIHYILYLYLINMDEQNQNKERWETVYEKEPESLPWFGIDFPSEVKDYLSSLNKDEKIRVTGCGFGDVAKKISILGFKDVEGTDISEKAIERAKERFPGLNFKAMATESIAEKESVNVLDWLNLHQIEAVKDYLWSLGNISKKLCIVWIWDEKGVMAKSYVHHGNVYFHDPSVAQEILKGTNLILKKQFTFNFETNPLSGNVRVHKAIGQIYEK